MKVWVSIIVICLSASNVFAEVGTTDQAVISEIIKLPKVQAAGGKSLVQSLKERRSSRNFSSKKLPKQVLSDLLWAAFGINRPDSGLRTAPSACNMQEIDIFVAMKDGLYLYNAKDHTLQLMLDEDIRSSTGEQEFVSVAAVNLIYVADYSRMDKVEDNKRFYSAVDTGFISQNVYLYCASKELATVARGWVNKDVLHKVMNLRPDQEIVLTQTVGYENKSN